MYLGAVERPEGDDAGPYDHRGRVEGDHKIRRYVLPSVGAWKRPVQFGRNTLVPLEHGQLNRGEGILRQRRRASKGPV